MAYNPNKRRGITRKHQRRQKLTHPVNASDPTLTNSPWFPYVQRFLEWGAVQGLSPNTTKQRETGLHRWLRWCDERGLDAPGLITKPIIERYQRHLYHYRRGTGEPLSVRYQHALLLPVKTFFKWLTRQNYVLYNPASELTLPKLPTRLPQVILSVEEVERVIQTPKTETPYGVRDRALLEVLYSTGIRKMECALLGVYDVDTGRKTLFVRGGKGSKDRLLPIGQRALYWVNRYRDEVRPELLMDINTPELFLTDYGEPFIKNRLTDLVKRYLHHAAIDKPGACHLFRHAMATHMLDNGADLRFIQMMLGHSELSTTEIYTHVSIDKLQQIHAMTHPAKIDRPD